MIDTFHGAAVRCKLGGHAMQDLQNTLKADQDFIAVEIERDIVISLRPEAAARGLPVKRLIIDLLQTLVCDDLVGAVLDDDVCSPPRRRRRRTHHTM